MKSKGAKHLASNAKLRDLILFFAEDPDFFSLTVPFYRFVHGEV